MSKLECWTRYDSKGNKYITCDDSSKKNIPTINMPRRTNTDRLRQLALDRDNMLNTERLIEQREERELDEFLDLDNFDNFLTESRRNLVIPDLLEANEQLDYDIIPMDLSRGSTQRRVEADDRREQFLERDRRQSFLEATNQSEARGRRRTFTQSLGDTTEFMGRTKTFTGNPLADNTPKMRKRSSGYTNRPISQLLSEGYLDSLGLPERPIRRHGTTGTIRGDGSMEEMTYLLKDITENPNKYKGAYGKKIKEHMEKYNTAYYYGLRRQEPEFRGLSLAKGQKPWNERANTMKNLLSNL